MAKRWSNSFFTVSGIDSILPRLCCSFRIHTLLIAHARLYLAAPLGVGLAHLLKTTLSSRSKMLKCLTRHWDGSPWPAQAPQITRGLRRRLRTNIVCIHKLNIAKWTLEEKALLLPRTTLYYWENITGLPYGLYIWHFSGKCQKDKQILVIKAELKLLRLFSIFKWLENLTSKS